MTRTCEIVYENDCRAPAGWRVGGLGGGMAANNTIGTRSTCFACGVAACTACSRRTEWFRYGRVRVCFDCKPPTERERRHRNWQAPAA